MLDETFARAFSHDLAPDYNDADPWSSHVVLGKRLRPYSLWHNFMLETIDSPLIHGLPPTHLDLVRAIAIFRSRFRQWSLPTRLGVVDLYHLARHGLPYHVLALDEYVKDFNSEPEFTVKSPTPSSGAKATSSKLIVGRAPEIFRMAAEMIGWSGWSDQKVWEMPMSEVRWYLTQALRDQLVPKGADVDFLTDEDREMQRKMREAGLK